MPGPGADWDGAKRIVDSALAAFGRLDILANNAGISRLTSIEEASLADRDLTIAIYLTGSVAMINWAAKH